MDAIWNRIHLEHPPNATFNLERQKFDTTAFLTTLDKVTNELNSQQLLHKEATILSRLIYRMKRKFRNDKGLKCMCKVNKALLNYLNLSLDKEYENLASCVELERKYVKVPSKQMIEYVLVRTQGFAKLMARVEEVSKYAAHFLKCRIAVGHAWHIALVSYSVVSRIWILSRQIVKQCCAWYNELYQYLRFFKSIGAQWLPKDYQLPNDLESWLELPWIKEPSPSVPSGYGLKNTMFRLIIPYNDNSDEDVALDSHDISTKIEDTDVSANLKREKITDTVVAKNTNGNILSSNDTGEIIDRNIFNSYHIKKKSDVSADSNPSLIHTEKKRQKFTKTVDTEDEKSEQITNTVNQSKTLFKNKEDTDTSFKEKKRLVEKSESSSKKEHPQKLLTFEDVKNKADLLTILSQDTYIGLDKLQWNMIRNKSRKLLDKFDECSEKTKQTVLFKKIVKRLQRWVT